MDDKKIRSILQDALEEEIPAAQVQLWPAVKASLVAGKHKPVQQGEKMNTVKSRRILRRVPRLALAVSTVVALLAVALLTPQGRALAQDVLQLFRRTENKSFPLEPSQIVTGVPNQVEPTAAPPAPLISVAEAEAQVGFDIAELPFTPDGFNYLGVRLYGNAASSEYETEDHGGHLHIQQTRGELNQSEWDRVPADAIVPVKIGALDGEFTQGLFVVYPGATSAKWEPNAAMLRLRWVKDGVWFEMVKSGNVQAIEYLDQAGMIKLAESLAVQP